MGLKGVSFNAKMVEAVMRGSKTVTRRLATAPEGRPEGKRPAEAGDVMFVRESHCIAGPAAASAPHTVNPESPDEACYYRAGWSGEAPGRWRRSMYMPRWAARLFLEAGAVRRERLQDITEEEARAEGFEGAGGKSAREAFGEFWDGIYSERGAGWEANPEVWRIEFEGFMRTTTQDLAYAAFSGPAPALVAIRAGNSEGAADPASAERVLLALRGNGNSAESKGAAG